MPEIELLDQTETWARLDPSGMLGVVEQMPEILQQAERFSAGVTLAKPKKYSQVICLGMGGSAIAGDIIADLYSRKVRVTFQVNRNYYLPLSVGPETLIIALSYSGETEETLTAVKEAEKAGATIICICSGGKLKELAENKRYPVFLVPGGYQPRAALPFLLISLLSALAKSEVISPPFEEIREAIVLLGKVKEEYSRARPTRTNPAKQLAKKLAGKIPVIFGTTGVTAAVARRFKTQLNENSKQTAIASDFPELDHNEIVNLATLKREESNFALIVLRDEGESERVKKRIEITKSLLVRQLGGVVEIVSQGKSPLARLLSLIYFNDLVTVYLALVRGIDPTPVEVITRLKKEMQR